MSPAPRMEAGTESRAANGTHLVDAEGEVDLVVAEGVHHLRVDREQALLCATERKRKGKERKGNVIDDERKGWLKMVKMEWRWKGKEGK